MILRLDGRNGVFQLILHSSELTRLLIVTHLEDDEFGSRSGELCCELLDPFLGNCDLLVLVRTRATPLLKLFGERDNTLILAFAGQRALV